MKRGMRILVAALFFVLMALPAWAGKGVVLNFSDVDIATMVKFISDLTGKNFILDDRVKGKISVYSPAKLTTDEAFNVFTSVLEMKGFTVIPSGKVLKIVPLSSARQSGTKVLTGAEHLPANEAYIARVIPLTYISSQDAVTFLQPVVSKDGQLTPFGPSNLILVIDAANNIQKVLDILGVVDTPQRREGAELVFLKNAPADSVAKLVAEWLGGRQKPGSSTSGASSPAVSTAAAGSGLVIPDTRLNALVVFGTDKDKEDIKRLVALVDVTPPSASSKINVYFLEHADATELVKVLDSFIKGSVAPAAGQQPASTLPQQSPFEGSKISVIADKPTNSLLIAASPNDYQSLYQVIQKLDKRRRQVYVQATIAEVSLTKLDELGVQWSSISGGSAGAVGAIGMYDSMGALANIGAAVSALKQAGITLPFTTGKAVNFAVVMSALESAGALSVLSTPNILTSDNKEAEIFVGENVPFIGNTSAVGGTSNTYQSIDRKDTGITLRITPQITEGDYIKMDVYQEISAIKPTVKTDATVNPSDIITTKRSAKTAVLVKNSENVVIGGLIGTKEMTNDRKVPLLGDIPGLGWLFKYKSTQIDKTNLIIMLTPQVVKDSAVMTDITENHRRQFNEAMGKVKPLDIPAELNRKP